MIIITGGAGFIGSHLVEYFLKRGEEVKVIDNFSNASINNIRGFLNSRKFKLVKGDIRDANLLNEHIKRGDKVFHLAAKIHVDESIINPKEFIDVNVGGTFNVLEASVKNDADKVIIASSSEVYGDTDEYPIKETSPLKPGSPYAASKVAADRLAFSYFNTYGLNTTIVRNFNIFGPRQKTTGYAGVIGIFIQRVLNNLPPIIYGDGGQTRDYIYVDDAILAYSLVSDSNKVSGETINFGSGQDISILDLAKSVIEICGKSSQLTPVHVESRPGEVRKLLADSTKAKDLLGFKTIRPFRDNLVSYIDWFRKYKDIQWVL